MRAEGQGGLSNSGLTSVPTGSLSRPIIIAGAGIGGLTAALALAAKGFEVVIIERAERLEEAGAGLQLSPNASRILTALDLAPALAACAITPRAISVRAARSGAEITRIPLGDAAAERAGAPYFVLHRADLQAALLNAVRATPAITLHLGAPFVSATTDANGVRVTAGAGARSDVFSGAALIGADGVWSAVRGQLFPAIQPQFAGRIAWRGTIAMDRLTLPFPPDEVQLWLGPGIHMVAYPVSSGREVNLVAFTPGTWRDSGWSASGDAADLKTRLLASRWSQQAHQLVSAVDNWTRWALFTVDSRQPRADGRIALLGDAAHAMLPFVAQGAAMAIEDAAVLAQCLASQPDAPIEALARYSAARAARVARVQRTARINDRIYHLGGPIALARDLSMKILGGERLLSRQDWIYRWRADR